MTTTMTSALVCFNDLKIGRKLGNGANCEVQEIWMDQEPLAMKYLSAQRKKFGHGKHYMPVGGPALDLRREASLMAPLKHENILRVHGLSAKSRLFQDDNDDVQTSSNDREEFVLVLDRLETTLDQQINTWREEEEQLSWRVRLQQRRSRLMDRLGVALQIASGMEYLHRHHNIIHRDMKPQNIGFDQEGVAKLFDFGLAMKLDQEDDLINHGGGRVGTPLYMAPEVLLRKSYGLKADVYSFALVLWQLCSLKGKPYDGNLTASTSSSGASKITQFTEAVGYEGARPSTENWWPRQVKNLMTRCWSGEPDSRPSFHEIVETLEGILS